MHWENSGYATESYEVEPDAGVVEMHSTLGDKQASLWESIDRGTAPLRQSYSIKSQYLHFPREGRLRADISTYLLKH